ncbi:polysaccharide export protein [Moraxella sp. FZLJ2107]|uniref:polysaccharide biosynthesis/export family protein n=1 Tax=unclassified Moraxella TaxID=2685852 RepID=UPI0020C882D9|nr:MULTISPECIES: polysaccharide biosynthesis/export family protein [unclassified Moraxella]UTO04512.1 polysaccharide export protein [Moraxella sp. FZLJ2107]UTO23345.1 polysaccharide export protein [Moraxella sp. FZLJ2109]
MMLKKHSLVALVAMAMSAQAMAADDGVGRLAGVVSANQVPAEATAAEAVAAASLGSNAIINNERTFQDVGTPVSTTPKIFGEQLFRGAFSTTSGSTFNDSYVINPGDNVQVRMWGAYQYAATMTVDPQGNIFLPNVGPVRVAGIQNGRLQSVVQSAIARIYRSNVGVYASLEQAQPVKVFVTGFVNQPGYYGGLAADSVLSYLDRAGGVDPERGSYIDIQIRRNGQVVQQVNLYDFLISGRLQPFAFRDGDVITVAPQKQTFSISGRVQNEYAFEFGVPNLTIADVLSIANPLADATNVSITRAAGRAQTAEYYALSEASQVPVNNGDVLVVTSDRYAGTIAVQVTGAHKGNGAVILPHGARLKDVIAQLEPSSLANLQNLSIYRKSVAEQQKQSINQALDRLEEMTLATQSITREEAQLRAEDAKLVEQFIAKARRVEPKGRIVVVPNSWQDVILQQGDIIEIPEQTSVITVNGQVRAQGALTFDPNLTVADYIAKSGGMDANADPENILVMQQNGETKVVNAAYRVQQGDEIMVLPKVKTRRVEIARGISQIFYQIAVAAGVIAAL